MAQRAYHHSTWVFYSRGCIIIWLVELWWRLPILAGSHLFLFNIKPYQLNICGRVLLTRLAISLISMMSYFWIKGLEIESHPVCWFVNNNFEKLMKATCHLLLGPHVTLRLVYIQPTKDCHLLPSPNATWYLEPWILTSRPWVDFWLWPIWLLTLSFFDYNFDFE